MIARIVAVENGRGLSRDMAILRPRLEQAGYRVQVCPPNRIPIGERVDLQLFLEIVEPEALGAAARNAVIPNPEFWEYWGKGWTPHVASGRLEVWAKTRHAAEVFYRIGAKCIREIGFTSEDRLDPAVPRERRFLHVAGASHRKGTALLVDSWRPDMPPLTVVCSPELRLRPRHLAPSVALRREHVSDAHLRQLQNACAFHLYPSEYEGFGHALWEGLSSGAVVLSPDCAPFDEIAPPGWGVPIAVQSFRFAPSKLVSDPALSPWAIEQAVRVAQGLPDELLGAMRKKARGHFEGKRAKFEERLAQALAG